LFLDLPVPQRLVTSLLCRGSGVKLGAGGDTPLALPTGQVFSKKYIFENAYICISTEEELALREAYENEGRHNRVASRANSVIYDDETVGDDDNDDDDESILSVNSHQDRGKESKAENKKLSHRFSDLSRVYFTCPVSNKTFSLDTLRPVYIT